MCINGILIFGTAVLSGIVVLLIQIPRTPLRLLLSFSGAFLFALSLLHLIPELYARTNETTGIWILVGFLVQLLMEYFTRGIEHGHDHHDHRHARKNGPIVIVLGLCTHAFLEGLPLGIPVVSMQTLSPFVSGIILHNIPISIAFAGMLLHLGLPKKRVIFHLILFAIMTPVGMLASNFIGAQLQGSLAPYFDAVMAIVVGIFLHISTTILFESTENHRFNAMKFGTIILGIVTAWIISHWA
jgi:zinc transporter ZupT